MHSAQLEKSVRLQRVNDFLMDGLRHSTRDIIRQAEVCAVNSIISELRANGKAIECDRVGNIWWYQMEINNGTC